MECRDQSFFQDAGTRALSAAVTNVAYIVGETGSLLMLRWFLSRLCAMSKILSIYASFQLKAQNSLRRNNPKTELRYIENHFFYFMIFYEVLRTNLSKFNFKSNELSTDFFITLGGFLFVFCYYLECFWRHFRNRNYRSFCKKKFESVTFE